MVRKISLFVMLLCGIVCVGTPPALAYSSYDDGNISTSVLAYYEDMQNNIGIDENYVISRVGQYDYIMAVGDLKFENGSFNCSNARIYEISTGSGYNSTYVFDVRNESQFNLSVGDNIVYSNLGDYPDIIQKGVIYDYLQTFTLLIIGICMLIRPMFQFILRSRG